MPKLIMCKGLPGSGKSTWAKAQDGYVRVNKDDIRIKLGMSRAGFKREQEFAVIDHRDHLISEALKAGVTVISDDTNFGKKHEPALRALAKKFGAEFEVKDFTDVPVETCIERDALRAGDARVGADVIWGMAESSLGMKRPAPYFNDPALPSCVICDLDGTLAIHQGRSPYDFEKCDTDAVNEPVRKILWAMFAEGQGDVSIIYLSGRDDIVQEKTEKWLNDSVCPPGPLYMRKTGDKRNDAIAKRELFDTYVAGRFYVEFVLDDRDRVVKMWRDLGLTCLQVNYGNF